MLENDRGEEDAVCKRCEKRGEECVWREGGKGKSCEGCRVAHMLCWMGGELEGPPVPKKVRVVKKKAPTPELEEESVSERLLEAVECIARYMGAMVREQKSTNKLLGDLVSAVDDAAQRFCEGTPDPEVPEEELAEAMEEMAVKLAELRAERGEAGDEGPI